MTKSTHEETCMQLFGAMPEDVVAPIDQAAVALSWLEEVFATISKEAFDPNNSWRIRRLADLGAHIAHFAADDADSAHEGMTHQINQRTGVTA